MCNVFSKTAQWPFDAHPFFWVAKLWLDKNMIAQLRWRSYRSINDNVVGTTLTQLYKQRFELNANTNKLTSAPNKDANMLMFSRYDDEALPCSPSWFRRLAC